MDNRRKEMKKKEKYNEGWCLSKKYSSIFSILVAVKQTPLQQIEDPFLQSLKSNLVLILYSLLDAT